jgi:hypothetical protein
MEFVIIGDSHSIAATGSSETAEIRGETTERFEVKKDSQHRVFPFSAIHGRSYRTLGCPPDCFAAALAKREKAEIYTGDPEFRTVEREIKVVWL